MHKTTNTFKFYIHFLLPYMLLLFIPIFIISYTSYKNYKEVLNSEITSNQFNKLNMIKSQVDNQYLSIRNTVYQMSSNGHLNDYIDKYSNLDRYNIISLLNSYNYNPFISELIIYKRNSDKILSSDCEYTIDEFINTYYRYNEWTEYEFKQFINNLKKDSIRSPEYITKYNLNKKKYTTLAYSFPKFTKNISSTILVLIEEKKFQSIYNKHKNVENENIIIMDNNRNIVSSYNDNLSNNDLELIYDNSLKNNSFISINKQKFSITSINSQPTGLTFISLYPTSVYMEKINTVQHNLIYKTIIMILFGSFIIILLIKKRYTPIFNIYNLINTSDVSSNYLKKIEKAITKLSKENVNLNKKIENETQSIKNSYLQRLLVGDFKNIHEFNQNAKDYSIHFITNKLFIIIIHMNNKDEDLNNLNNIKRLIEIYIQDKLNAYLIDNNFDNNYFVFISSSTDKKLLEIHLEKTKEYINATFNMNCTIGIGNEYSILAQIKNSLIEAKTAIEYDYVKGKNKIINYNDISYTSSNINWYPIKLFEDINNSIYIKDIKEIHKNIDIFHYNIKNNNLSLPIVKCLCYELINIITKQIYEINIYEQINKHYKINIMTLLRCENIEELISNVKNICTYMCEDMIISPEHKNANMKEKFLRYIQENCFSCDFSIKDISDYFNISQSSLSQQFKHCTGNTVSHYVDNLRIEKSKALLKTTKLPIKDIIVQIGYYDSSSFTRKFKQMVGMTPGKYRSLYKK